MQCLVDCVYIEVVGYMDRWIGEWVHKDEWEKEKIKTQVP